MGAKYQVRVRVTYAALQNVESFFTAWVSYEDFEAIERFVEGTEGSPTDFPTIEVENLGQTNEVT